MMMMMTLMMMMTNSIQGGARWIIGTATLYLSLVSVAWIDSRGVLLLLPDGIQPAGYPLPT